MEKSTALYLCVLAIIVFAIVFYSVDRYAAYRSPLYGAQPDWAPHQDGLKALEEWRAEKKAEEKRRAELLRNLTTETMVKLGEEIVLGRGKCLNCHKVGGSAGGDRGPNLADVGARAGSRLGGVSDLDYLAQSLYEPDAFVVPGYSRGMTPANQASHWTG